MIKISDLPSAGPIVGVELLEIVQEGQSRKVPIDELPVTGPQGEPGEPGERGITWYTGTGVPGVLTPTPQENDLYLNFLNGDVYKHDIDSFNLAGNIRGVQGAQGIQGVQGTQGPQGIPGQDGAPGEPGADGAPGVDGEDGAPGAQGIQGIQGDPGPQGIQGIQGPQGLQGPQGEQGDPGTPGESAYVLAQQEGFVGTLPEWLQSLIGAQGPQGIQGVPGQDGLNGGVDGEDGLSAFEVAQGNGFVGTEAQWLESLKGDTGEQGPRSVAWFSGTGTPGGVVTDPIDGDLFVNLTNGDVYRYAEGVGWDVRSNLMGPQGLQGEQGDQGIQGIPGTPGAPGADGDDGAPGAPGADGADGTPGTIWHSGVGDPDVAVSESIDGEFYLDTGNGDVYEKESGDWVLKLNLVGPQGPAGTNGSDGEDGADGAAGATGATGQSAFQIAQTNGFVGDVTQWLASLVGAQGIQGVAGTDGDDGATGATGARGSKWNAGAGAPGVIGGVLTDDFYLNLTNGDVYQYTGSAWTATGGNIRGPQGIQGVKGDTGDEGPQGDQGIQGIQGIQGVQGTPGVDGDDGAAGARGSLTYTGAGAPGTISGQAQGDHYLNTTNGDYYERGASSWDLVGNIRGPQGVQGNPGVDGDDGAQGIQGVQGDTGERGATIFNGAGAPGIVSGEQQNDYYINNTNGDLYQRGSSAWSVIGNIRGPQGIQGVAGVDGEDGAPGAPGADGADGADGQDYTVGTHATVTALETAFPAADNDGLFALVGSGAPYKFRVSNGTIWSVTGSSRVKTVGASRDITADDDGDILEVTADGVTLTVPSGLYGANQFATVVIPNGTTSIASSSGTLLNGATSTVDRASAVNQTFCIMGLSTANSYLVTGA